MLLRLVLFALASVAPLPAGVQPDAADAVGFYHWGGAYPASVGQGVRRVAALGAKVARITISARYRRDYNMGQECQPGFTLKGAASGDPDVGAALAEPGIRVMILTVLDGATYGDCATPDALRPVFYTDTNRAAIEQEYSDFTLWLHERFYGSGRQFILSNWEGDNWIYCGSAYSYVSDAKFRSWCDVEYPALYGGNRSPADSLRGMVMWMQARANGIRDGKRRAAVAGLGGVEVASAPEISAVRMLRDGGYLSVLYDVIPRIEFDYLSYSAYESINHAEPARSLRADLDLIRSVSGASRIIIGEAGFARSRWGAESVRRTVDVQQAALDWGVSYVIHWNLFDQDEVNDFGLFDRHGMMTPLGQHFVGVFRASPLRIIQMDDDGGGRGEHN